MKILKEMEPLPYEKLVENLNSTREHAERTFARWRRAVDEDDPAMEVWYNIALQHGQMYLVLRALVEDRRNPG